MRNKWLDAALAALRRMSADPSRESARWERLRKEVRELEKIRRSGKVDYDRLFRVVAVISEELVESTRTSVDKPESTTVDRRAG